MITKLREVYEEANRKLPELYEKARFSQVGDYTDWNTLQEAQERLVGETRRILGQILRDFDRSAVSDGSWNDTQYSTFFEHDPRRLVEIYCSDTRGLMVILDYSTKLDLKAKQFPQGILVPRPTCDKILTNEERKNLPIGTEVDVWKTLEQLIMEDKHVKSL